MLIVVMMNMVVVPMLMVTLSSFHFWNPASKTIPAARLSHQAPLTEMQNPLDFKARNLKPESERRSEPWPDMLFLPIDVSEPKSLLLNPLLEKPE